MSTSSPRVAARAVLQWLDAAVALWQARVASWQKPTPAAADGDQPQTAAARPPGRRQLLLQPTELAILVALLVWSALLGVVTVLRRQEHAPVNYAREFGWLEALQQEFTPRGHTVARYVDLIPFRRPPATRNCVMSPYTESNDAKHSALVASVWYPPGSASKRKRAACVALKSTLYAQYADDVCPAQGLCMVPSALPVGQGASVSVLNELGGELLAYIPWVYIQAVRGELSLSYSAADSAPFYFFSPRHCEAPRSAQRRHTFIPPEDETPWPRDGNGSLITPLVTAASIPQYPRHPWMMPPFRAHFCGGGHFWWSGLPYIVVFNKRNVAEWNDKPVNTLSQGTLRALYDLLSPHYIVVYHRATAGLHASEVHGFAGDRSDMRDLEAHARRGAASGGNDNGNIQRHRVRGTGTGTGRAPRPTTPGGSSAAGGLPADAPQRRGHVPRVHWPPAAAAVATPTGAGATAAATTTSGGGGGGVPGHLVLLPDVLQEARAGYRRIVAGHHAREGGGGNTGGSHLHHPHPPLARHEETDDVTVGGLSINELLLSALSDADGVVAVQGGPSYLSLLWGPNSTTVIFQQKGPEVEHDGPSWFPVLSGTRTYVTGVQAEVVEHAYRAFVEPLERRAGAPRGGLAPTLDAENAVLLRKRGLRRALVEGDEGVP